MGLYDPVHVATFLKIITSFYTYFCCLLIFIFVVVVSCPLLFIGNNGVFIVLADSHQGSLKAIVDLNHVISNNNNCSECQRYESKLHLPVYICINVFLCALFLSYQKRIYKAISSLHLSYLGLFYFPYYNNYDYLFCGMKQLLLSK